MPAAGYGSQGGVVVISGVDKRPERKGEAFLLYETAGGPSGATVHKDGLHGTRVGTGNAGNIPVESVEMHNPVRIERYEIVPDTCGAGRQRGGCAVRRTYRLLSDEATAATIYERAKFRPYGLFGGRPAALALVRRRLGETPEREVTPKSRPFPVSEGEIIVVQTAGGGGYGNALERDPEAVCADVVDGFISLDMAAAEYGVVLDPRTLRIDHAATTRLRAAASAKRV